MQHRFQSLHLSTAYSSHFINASIRHGTCSIPRVNPSGGSGRARRFSRAGENTASLLAGEAGACLGNVWEPAGGDQAEKLIALPHPLKNLDRTGGGEGFSRRDGEGFADPMSPGMCWEVAVAKRRGRGFCPAAARASLQPPSSHLYPIAPGFIYHHFRAYLYLSLAKNWLLRSAGNRTPTYT